MPHSYTNLLYHIVFSTKERAPSINNEIRPRLLAYLGGIARELNATLLAAGGTEDHVHLLLSLSSSLSVADALRVLKTNSSRWVHQKWPSQRRFAWQSGYGAFSVSQSVIDDVRRYIANQEEHHRRMTFQEEFIALLKRHGIEFDKRYLWR